MIFWQLTFAGIGLLAFLFVVFIIMMTIKEMYKRLSE